MRRICPQSMICLKRRIPPSSGVRALGLFRGLLLEVLLGRRGGGRRRRIFAAFSKVSRRGPTTRRGDGGGAGLTLPSYYASGRGGPSIPPGVAPCDGCICVRHRFTRSATRLHPCDVVADTNAKLAC